MNLSPNFTLEELTASEIASRKGIDNTPNVEIQANLVRLARFLEEVRVLLGRPIIINSAYRSVKVNKAVGGKPDSQHCLGCAADIKVPGLTPNDVVSLIVKSDLQYDQVIREFDSWTHISIPSFVTAPPRKKALIIDKYGTRSF